MNRTFRWLILVGLAQLLLVSVVQAAEVKLGSLPASDANLDLAIPSSPAFYALNVTPETVSRPASPRELGIDILNGLDKNGNFQTGVAVDTVPYLLFAGDRLTINEYRNNWWARLGARTQLSVATTKGTDAEDKATRASIGLRIVPYDKGDPRLHRDLDACFTEIPLPPPPKPGETLVERDKRFKDEMTAILTRQAQACREKDKKKYWNASAWELGAAPTWVQKEGAESQTKWGGATFWTSYAYGFENSATLKDTSQLVIGLRYSANSESATSESTGTYIRQNSAMVGTRLILGKPDLHVSFEGSYLMVDTKGEHTTNGYRFSFAPEFKLPIADNLWFQFSIGGTGGGGDNKLFVMSSIKFGNGDTLDASNVLSMLGVK